MIGHTPGFTPGSAGGTTVNQTFSTVDVEIGGSELDITLEGQIVIELASPQIVLCEE
jgi:hypothetical protein